MAYNYTPILKNQDNSIKRVIINRRKRIRTKIRKLKDKIRRTSNLKMPNLKGIDLHKYLLSDPINK